MAPAVASSTACPACHSLDTRPSQKTGRFESLHSWRNEQRYRCRECRQSFYVAVSPAERAKIRASENVRKKRARGWHGFVQSRTQRRLIEALLFLGMLFIFYCVFNSLVSKDGTGIFSRPTTEAQP